MLILASLMSALRGPLAGLAGAIASTLLLVLAIFLGFKLIGAQQRATTAQAALHGVEVLRDAYRANLEVCTANSAKLAGAVDAQNASITLAKVAAEDQLRRAQASVDEARRDASTHEQKLRQLLDKPPQGTNRCDAANAAIDLAIGQ